MYRRKEHAKPGQGILSLKNHRKLEDFIFGKHTILSIYITTLTFFFALLLDDGLRGFVIKTFTEAQTLNEMEWTAVVLISFATVTCIYYIYATIRQKKHGSLFFASGYVLASLMTFFIATEYALEILSDKRGAESILLVLAMYYFYSGFITFIVSIRDSSYLTNRIKLTQNYSTSTLFFATILVITTSILFMTKLTSMNVSWAYVATLNSILWASASRTFILKD